MINSRTHLSGSVRVKGEVDVNISETILCVCHEVGGVFDRFGDQMSRIKRVHDGLLKVLVIRLLSQVRQVYSVEESLVPEVSFVTHFLKSLLVVLPVVCGNLGKISILEINSRIV